MDHPNIVSRSRRKRERRR